jgi:hypothetical protein
MQITPDLDLKRLQLISLSHFGSVGISLTVITRSMAPKCYIGTWKSAERLNTPKGSPELALMLCDEPRSPQLLFIETSRGRLMKWN